MSLFNKLEFADIFRDGGSYEARFRNDDGQRLVLYLEAHHDSPRRHQLRHSRLFKYVGEEMPADAQPIAKGSADEYELLRELELFLSRPQFTGSIREPEYSMERLREMIQYIPNREDAS